jgi:hypothetical protein
MGFCLILPIGVSYSPLKLKEEIWNTLSTKATNIKELERAITFEQIDSIVEFGRITTDKFLMDSIYIIKTALKTITELTIWNVFQKSNITACTLILKYNLRQCIQKRLGLRLLLGIDRKKGKNIFRVLLKNIGVKESPLEGLA